MTKTSETPETPGAVGPAEPAVLAHAALVVTSVDRAAQFYGSVLGLDRLRTCRMSDHTLAYLSSGTDVEVELIEYDDAPPEGSRRPGPQDIAPRHLAWRVDDVGAAVGRAVELGGGMVSEPVPVPELGCVSALARDPDGIEFELVSPLP